MSIREAAREKFFKDRLSAVERMEETIANLLGMPVSQVDIEVRPSGDLRVDGVTVRETWTTHGPCIEFWSESRMRWYNFTAETVVKYA